MIGEFLPPNIHKLLSALYMEEEHAYQDRRSGRAGDRVELEEGGWHGRHAPCVGGIVGGMVRHGGG